VKLIFPHLAASPLPPQSSHQALRPFSIFWQGDCLVLTCSSPEWAVPPQSLALFSWRTASRYPAKCVPCWGQVRVESWVQVAFLFLHKTMGSFPTPLLLLTSAIATSVFRHVLWFQTQTEQVQNCPMMTTVRPNSLQQSHSQSTSSFFGWWWWWWWGVALDPFVVFCMAVLSMSRSAGFVCLSFRVFPHCDIFCFGICKTLT
jgi:hypothetical protein